MRCARVCAGAPAGRVRASCPQRGDGLGDRGAISKGQEELEAAEELLAFVPRLEVGAAEMFHRWEMQREPPDILVTNVSMLSIMPHAPRAPRASP